jgi:hypothetical protein
MSLDKLLSRRLSGKSAARRALFDFVPNRKHPGFTDLRLLDLESATQETTRRPVSANGLIWYVPAMLGVYGLRLADFEWEVAK